MPNEIFIIIKIGHSVIHTRKKLNILIVNVIGVLHIVNRECFCDIIYQFRQK